MESQGGIPRAKNITTKKDPYWLLHPFFFFISFFLLIHFVFLLLLIYVPSFSICSLQHCHVFWLILYIKFLIRYLMWNTFSIWTWRWIDYLFSCTELDYSIPSDDDGHCWTRATHNTRHSITQIVFTPKFVLFTGHTHTHTHWSTTQNTLMMIVFCFFVIPNQKTKKRNPRKRKTKLIWSIRRSRSGLKCRRTWPAWKLWATDTVDDEEDETSEMEAGNAATRNSFAVDCDWRLRGRGSTNNHVRSRCVCIKRRNGPPTPTPPPKKKKNKKQKKSI